MTLTMSAAAVRAEKFVGGSTPHGEAGWCLEWSCQVVYGHNGPYKWGGSGAAWAINYWDAAKRWGRVVETSDPTRIPRGAMTFSKGKSKFGHVFISLGDGWCASTDYPTARRIGRIRITDLMTGWGHKLLGYIEVTGDGVDLRDKGPVDRMDPSQYYVGAHGDHVLWLGQRLVEHGITRYTPTRDFTKSDLRAVAAFQRAQGWDGPGADGLPGEETLRRLAAKKPKQKPPAPKPPAPTPVRIDLRPWKWNGPVGKEDHPIEVRNLAGYSKAPYFVQMADRIRFRCPVDGVTTKNSDNPRSELRELTDGEEADWSTTEDSHRLAGDFAVVEMPGKKKGSKYVPGVVVAQLHDADDDVVMLVVRGSTVSASWSKGKDKGSEVVSLLTGLKLHQRVTYEITAAGGVITVRVNDHATTKRLNRSGVYAKAGAYCQGNESNSTGAAEVDYFALTITHS